MQANIQYATGMPRHEQPARARRAPVESDVLFELLTNRLQSDFGADLWRQIVTGEARESVRFESCVVTFLAVAGLAPEWTRAALTTFARKQGGHVESFRPAVTFAFAEARHALKLAVLLQADAAHTLRMALLTAPCTLACFKVDGCEGRVSLGCEARVAADEAVKAAKGSIYVWGDTYPLIARTLERPERGATVAKVVHQGVVTSAVISFPRMIAGSQVPACAP